MQNEGCMVRCLKINLLKGFFCLLELVLLSIDSSYHTPAIQSLERYRAVLYPTLNFLYVKPVLAVLGRYCVVSYPILHFLDGKPILAVPFASHARVRLVSGYDRIVCLDLITLISLSMRVKLNYGLFKVYDISCL